VLLVESGAASFCGVFGDILVVILVLVNLLLAALEAEASVSARYPGWRRLVVLLCLCLVVNSRSVIFATLICRVLALIRIPSFAVAV